MKFVFAFFLVLLSSGCHSKLVETEIYRIEKSDFQSRVLVFRFWREEPCSIFTCGESSAKMVDMGLRFEILDSGGARIGSSIIRCSNGKNSCFNYRTKFGLCNNKFIPLEHHIKYLVDGEVIDKTECDPKIVVEI